MNLILYMNMCVSFYLQLSKYIDLDHLCYICLASSSSPTNLSTKSLYLSHLVLPFKLEQKTGTIENFSKQTFSQTCGQTIKWIVFWCMFILWLSLFCYWLHATYNFFNLDCSYLWSFKLASIDVCGKYHTNKL